MDDEGEVQIEKTLARIGHSQSRVIHATYAESLPKNLDEDDGRVLTFPKPSEEEIEKEMAETQNVLQGLLDARTAAATGKSNSEDPQFIRHESERSGQVRLLQITEAKKDPLEPPKFKHKRIPKPPASPPAPILHSPPRKLTVEQVKGWRIPPCVSSWKNPKGYTIPLDKRMTVDGRGLPEAVAYERFAGFAEALYLAERHTKEEIETKRQAEQEEQRLKEEKQAELLREAAERARLEQQRYGRDMRDRHISERKQPLHRTHERMTEEEHLFDTRLFNRNSTARSHAIDEVDEMLYEGPLFKSGAATIDALYKPGNARRDAEIYRMESEEGIKRRRKLDDSIYKEGPVRFEAPVPLGSAPKKQPETESKKHHENDTSKFEKDLRKDVYGIDEFLAEARRRTEREQRYFNNKH